MNDLHTRQNSDALVIAADAACNVESNIFGICPECNMYVDAEGNCLCNTCKMNRFRFTVMRLYSEYPTKWALTMIGLRGDMYIVPKYIKIRYGDEQVLRMRADHLNNLLAERGKLLPG